MDSKYVNIDALIDTVRKTIIGGAGLTNADIADRAEKAIGASVRGKPEFPKLVGRKVAAQILGVNPPYITRLEKQGRLDHPVPIEGTSDAFVKADIVKLGKELAKEREARAAQQAAKKAATEAVE